MPKVLVVDDNNENLIMTGRMLDRLSVDSVKVDCGNACIETLKSGEKFDLILMDYMMEGLDGIETTKLIRSMKSDFSSIPIIAFTANGTETLKKAYLSSGMNGYLIKPVDLISLRNALADFFPGIASVDVSEPENNEDYPDLVGVNKEDAIKYSGASLSVYKEILASFYSSFEKNTETIRRAFDLRDTKAFTIEVHGVKSSARTAGMTTLAEVMAKMEAAGNERNYEYIASNLEEALCMYLEYAKKVKPFFDEVMQQRRKAVTDDPSEQTLVEIRNLLDDFETEEAKNLFLTLSKDSFGKDRQEIFERLCQAFDEDDYYASLDYVDELLDTYSK